MDKSFNQNNSQNFNEGENNNQNYGSRSTYENQPAQYNQQNNAYQTNIGNQQIDNQINNNGQANYVSPTVANQPNGYNFDNYNNQQYSNNQNNYNNLTNKNEQYMGNPMNNNSQPSNYNQPMNNQYVSNTPSNFNQSNMQMNSNTKDIKEYIGLIGCILVAIGCFLPFASALGYSTSYISGDGKIVLIAIIVSGILMYLKKDKLSLIPAGIGGLIFLFDAIKVLGASGVAIGIGLIVIFIGFILTIGFPLLKNKLNLN